MICLALVFLMKCTLLEIITPVLRRYLAGMQYVLGDLKADATPGIKKMAVRRSLDPG